MSTEQPDDRNRSWIDDAAEQLDRDLDSHMRRNFPVRYWLVRAGEWLSGRLRRDH